MKRNQPSQANRRNTEENSPCEASGGSDRSTQYGERENQPAGLTESAPISGQTQETMSVHSFGTCTTGPGGPLMDIADLPTIIEGLRFQDTNSQSDIHDLELDRILIRDNKITIHEDKLYLERGKTKKIKQNTGFSHKCEVFCRTLTQLTERGELDGIETTTMYSTENNTIDYVLWKLLYFDLVQDYLCQLTDDQIHAGQVTATWNSVQISPQETQAIIRSLKNASAISFHFRIAQEDGPGEVDRFTQLFTVFKKVQEHLGHKNDYHLGFKSARGMSAIERNVSARDLEAVKRITRNFFYFVATMVDRRRRYGIGLLASGLLSFSPYQMGILTGAILGPLTGAACAGISHEHETEEEKRKALTLRFIQDRMQKRPIPSDYVKRIRMSLEDYLGRFASRCQLGLEDVLYITRLPAVIKNKLSQSNTNFQRPQLTQFIQAKLEKFEDRETYPHYMLDQLSIGTDRKGELFAFFCGKRMLQHDAYQRNSLFKGSHRRQKANQNFNAIGQCLASRAIHNEEAMDQTSIAQCHH